MDPHGHLQATGLDAAARKQYLYHERWRTHRDRLKFGSMIAFGGAPPSLRRSVTRDLRSSYIDPRVIDHFHVGATIAELPAGTPDLANTRTRARIEEAVLELLAEAPASRRAA